MIYHIASRGSWPLASGVLEPDSLTTEGFIHCSYWRQLPRVVNSYFSRDSELVVLEIDPELISEPIRDEDLYDAGEAYPHLYGPIPESAVTGTLSVEWGPQGTPRIVRDVGSGASGDLRCRVASSADIALLARLNAQLIVDEGHDNPMNRSELVTRMDDFLGGTYRAYLFELGSEGASAVSGYALVDHGRTPAYLRQFFIQRGLRGGGIGTAAFELLTHQPGIGDLSVEVLTRNRPAVEFWHSVGFTDRCLGMDRRSDTGVGVSDSGGAR
jgi:uncharacterized protein (DUF952 family)/GNAT superfamily N-acetyltransferase